MKAVIITNKSVLGSVLSAVGLAALMSMLQMGCSNDHRQQNSSSSEHEVAAATALIEACPTWTRIETGDVEKPRTIMITLGKLDDYQTPILRLAMARYWDSTPMNVDN